MAIYSTAQSNSSYGNVAMSVNIYRGDITGRTETAVSFNFGVSFKPTVSWTTNSVAAFYGGTQKFASVTVGKNSKSTAAVGTTYYAHYDDRSSKVQRTSESLCFSFYTNNISATTNSVKVSIGVGWDNWAGTNMGTMTFSLSIPEYHGALEDTGSVAITDHKNNSFTVTGTKASPGTNNPVKGTGLWTAQYKYSDGSWMWSGEDNTKLEQTIALGGLTNSNQRHVAGFLRSYATYGNNADASNTAWIDQYRPPSNPTNVHLEWTKSRLTVKEMWTLKWDANNLAANTTSPVKGYRIRMIVNGTNRPILDAYYRQLSSQTGTDYYYDTENTLTSLDIWPGVNGINPGDKVRFNIFAYSKNGLGEVTWSVGENKYSLWSGSGISPAESPAYEVQNAGVVHVKVDGQWKEGIVHVKANGQWKEADVVYTKVGDTWEESE